MEEKKFNYIHLISAIIITAILVYVFTPKTEILEPDYEENLKELYSQLKEQSEEISHIQDKLQEVESDTSEIISYVDAMYEKMFPDSKTHSINLSSEQ